MGSYLQISQVAKAFSTQTVLKDISIDLGQGECLVLLGPSGCGKTTLLNIISGGLHADRGELICDGAVLDAPARAIHVPMRKRGFAMVFQEFSLWPHMTVAENVAFGLSLRGMSRFEREEKTSAALAQVHMEALANRWPSELSGGQQQRVAIARALVVRPRLLLLDEPLSALDARMRETLKEEIATLLKEAGITAVYVTHDQTEAFTVGDRIAVMNQGRLEQVGAPEEIYREPQTRFVAGFIGASNLFSYTREGGHWQLDGQVRLEREAPRAWPHRGHLLLRREAVSIRMQNGRPRIAQGNEVCLTGTCLRERFLGDRHEIFAHIGKDLIFRGISPARIPKGAAVDIAFSIDDVRLLTE
ncbi:MAG: ABC transporter ATP-binding protein [Opitutales bacterium]|nr:ABC transporter ATP-binding protein [Opitutales bacterium]